MEDKFKTEVEHFKKIIKKEKRLKKEDRKVIFLIGEKGSGKTTLTKNADKKSISLDQIVEKDVENFFIKSKNVAWNYRVLYFIVNLLKKGSTYAVFFGLLGTMFASLVPWVFQDKYSDWWWILAAFAMPIFLSIIALWYTKFPKKTIIIENSNNLIGSYPEKENWNIMFGYNPENNTKEHIEWKKELEGWKKDLEYKIRWLQINRPNFLIVVEMSEELLNEYNDIYKYKVLVFYKYEHGDSEIRKIIEDKMKICLKNIKKIYNRKQKNVVLENQLLELHKEYIDSLQPGGEHFRRTQEILHHVITNYLDRNLHFIDLILREYETFIESNIFYLMHEFFLEYLRQLGISINKEKTTINNKNKYIEKDLEGTLNQLFKKFQIFNIYHWNSKIFVGKQKGNNDNEIRKKYRKFSIIDKFKDLKIIKKSFEAATIDEIREVICKLIEEEKNSFLFISENIKSAIKVNKNLSDQGKSELMKEIVNLHSIIKYIKDNNEKGHNLWKKWNDKNTEDDNDKEHKEASEVYWKDTAELLEEACEIVDKPEKSILDNKIKFKIQDEAFSLFRFCVELSNRKKRPDLENKEEIKKVFKKFGDLLKKMESKINRNDRNNGIGESIEIRDNDIVWKDSSEKEFYLSEVLGIKDN